MTKSAHPERETQKRIVTFFQKELGYEYLGNLEDSENYNVRWGDWKKFLYDSGFSVDFVDAIQTKFAQILSDFSQSPYYINKEVYRILKYGLKLAEHSGATSNLIPFLPFVLKHLFSVNTLYLQISFPLQLLPVFLRFYSQQYLHN